MGEQQKLQVSSNSESKSNSDRTRKWIDVDESAKQMLSRIFIERPFMIYLPPPLHRIPFRLGNVLEIFGTSPSAKTHILIQAAISFILPNEWNGVHYGGFNHLVMFIDLDCRFDILRMSEMLKHRIMKVKGEPNNNLPSEALHDFCMGRFLYVCCSNSFEFLAALKTLHNRLKKEKDVHGLSAHLLLIDRSTQEFHFINLLSLKVLLIQSLGNQVLEPAQSIGAFHWIDRATTVFPIRDNNKFSVSKGPFLQYVSETVVREIKSLLKVHPMLVIATKSTISGDKHILASHQMKGGSTNVIGNFQQFQHRDYMPCAWQSFVTHRLLIRVSDNQVSKENEPTRPFYLSEWLLPQLNLSDKFVVEEAGIFLAS